MERLLKAEKDVGLSLCSRLSILSKLSSHGGAYTFMHWLFTAWLACISTLLPYFKIKRNSLASTMALSGIRTDTRRFVCLKCLTLPVTRPRAWKHHRFHR